MKITPYKPLLTALCAGSVCLLLATSARAQQSDSLRSDLIDPQVKAQLREGFRSLGSQIQDAISKIQYWSDPATDNNATASLPPDSAKSFGGNQKEQRKEIVKTYTVGRSDRLRINNKYGEVRVSTWPKSEIRVEITILVKGAPASESGMLNAISVKESRPPGEISLVTEIAEFRGNGWKDWFGGSSGQRYEINYRVFMPKENPLAVEDNYGRIVLPDMDGPVELISAYGSLEAGSLLNSANTLSLRYGKGDIAALGNAVLHVAYSELNLQKGGKINLTHKYGNLTIGQAVSLTGDLAYSKVEVHQVQDAVRMNLHYVSNFELDLSTKVRNVDLDAAYSQITLVVPPSLDLGFDVGTHYGSFNFSKSKAVMNADQDSGQGNDSHFTHEYQGHFGTGPEQAHLKITSHYTNISLR